MSQDSRLKQFAALQQVPLWSWLVFFWLVYLALGTALFVLFEQWSTEEAFFYTVSVALAVGWSAKHPIRNNISSIFTCIHAVIGCMLLAAAGALLVRHVLLRDNRFIKQELERLHAPNLEAAATSLETVLSRSSLLRHGLDIDSGRGKGGKWSRKWKRLLVIFAWLLLLIFGFFYGLYADLPARGQSPTANYAFALLWAFSAMTGLGLEQPGSNPIDLNFSSLFILLAVPLNAAVFALVMDVYIAHVQRSQARQRVLTQRSLGKETFLAIVAAVPEPLSKRSSRQKSGEMKITWGMYLEYWLRQMEGTEVHAKLLDEIKDSFMALDSQGKGFISYDDLLKVENSSACDHLKEQGVTVLESTAAGSSYCAAGTGEPNRFSNTTGWSSTVAGSTLAGPRSHVSTSSCMLSHLRSMTEQQGQQTRARHSCGPRMVTVTQRDRSGSLMLST